MEAVAVTNGLLVGFGCGGDPGDPGWDYNGSYCHGGGCRLSVGNGWNSFTLLCRSRCRHTGHEGHHADTVSKLPIHLVVLGKRKIEAMLVRCCV